MKKSLFLILILPFCLFANEKKYTVSVCTTSNLENALVCKKRIYDNTIGEVFIVKQNQKYYREPLIINYQEHFSNLSRNFS